MNNTYLIFFGKSQDFSFHAFDSKSYINNFDTIIKDFDELESKIFTVDDVSNTQILSKYIFGKNGKTYSLLKLYSLAQAYSGNRIDGSIYGVALLSENDIKISESNIAILDTAKKSFTQLSLNGVKFKTSNFQPDAEKIWKALVSHSNGNYLEKVDYNHSGNVNINKNVKAFLVKDVLKQSSELNDEITKTSRLYFSDDLAHLKRTQERRGKDVFPFYQKESGSYALYKEVQAKPTKPTSGTKQDGESRLRLENGELKRELADTGQKFKEFKKAAAQKIRIVSIAAVVFCLATLAFFFKSLFSDTPKTVEPDTVVAEQEQNSQNQIATENQPKNGTLDLTAILVDDTKRTTLTTLLENIKQHSNAIEQKKKRYYDAIVRDVNTLGIDPSFAEKYQPEEKTVIQNTPTTEKPIVVKPIEQPKKEVSKKNEDKIVKKTEPKQQKKKDDSPKTITTLKDNTPTKNEEKEQVKKQEPPKEDTKKETEEETK